MVGHGVDTWKVWLGWWELDWQDQARCESFLLEHSSPWAVRRDPRERSCIALPLAFGKYELACVREILERQGSRYIHHLPLFAPSFLVSKCTAGRRGLQSPSHRQPCSCLQTTQLTVPDAIQKLSLERPATTSTSTSRSRHGGSRK